MMVRIAMNLVGNEFLGLQDQDRFEVLANDMRTKVRRRPLEV